MQSKAVFWSQRRHWTHLFLSSSQLVVLSENTDRSQKYTLFQVFIRDGSSNNFLLRCWQVPWQIWFKACRRDMECTSGCDSGSEDCCVPAVLILRVTGVCLGYLSLATNPWPSGQNIEAESILKLRNFRILHTCCLSLLSVGALSTMTNTKSNLGKKGLVQVTDPQSLLRKSKAGACSRNREGSLLTAFPSLAFSASFFYITLVHLPRGGIVPSWLGPPTSINN